MENVFSVRPTGKFPEKVEVPELPGLPSKQFHFFWEFSSRANPKKRFPFSPELEFSEFSTKWKAPLVFLNLNVTATKQHIGNNKISFHYQQLLAI